MEEFLFHAYAFAKEWQTLLGALIALCAAVWTIGVMRRQAKNEERRHQDQISRRELAMRAQMPDALADVSVYAKNVGDYVLGLDSQLPQESSIAISSLKQVIEHIQIDAAQRTFELVSWYQVQRARLEDYSTQPRVYQRSDLLYDGILLHAHACSLFEYARNEATNVSTERPSFEEMQSSLRQAVDLEFRARKNPQLEKLDALIKQRHHSS